MCTSVDKKKTTLAPNSESDGFGEGAITSLQVGKGCLTTRFSEALINSASGIHPVSRSSRHKWSSISSRSLMSSILRGGTINKHQDRSAKPALRRAVRVLDSDGNDVTPLPLLAPGVMHSKPDRFFLDEMFSGSESEYSKYTSSFIMSPSSSFIGGSLPMTLPATAPLTQETEESIVEIDVPKAPDMTVSEEKLDEVVDIYHTETDTISLLDIPPTFVSEDADGAEAIKEKNIQYANLCKNKMGNDKYVERSVQTFDGASKDEQVQSDKIVLVQKGTMATAWDIYDSFRVQNETLESKKAGCPENTVNANKGQKKRGETNYSCTTVSTGRTISSLLESEICGNNLNLESDPELIMLSESFQHSLLVMERSILGNIYQSKFAAYRQLPILEDHDSTAKPGAEEQSEEGEESSSFPTLKRLWAFSCELTRGYYISSMAWNKQNKDFLAVGYGHCDFSCQKQGLICCWSIKNPTWPERVFNCRSCVASLDFAASNPSTLGVGMYDGTVAIYDVQSQNNTPCAASSSECSEKHLGPVWQVSWTKQEIGNDALYSVSEDGRIAKWIHCNNGFDCLDVMKLKKTQNVRKRPPKENKKTGVFFSEMDPGFCFDFHPTASSIYLAGTKGGLIHKCSLSNTEHFLDTYKRHFCPVNHIEWSPFSCDVFLSCSSDWTIQLWKQDLCTPVLSFTSTQDAVLAVRWSPNWSTIFAAIKEQQVEIWDLNSNIQFPTIVHHAAPGVKLTSVLFTRGTDCVLVGDSEGQVTVYKLRNLSVGEGKQVDSLDDIIHAEVSRLL